MTAGSVVLARSVVLTVPFNNVEVVFASSAAITLVLASLVSVPLDIVLVVLASVVMLATEVTLEVSVLFGLVVLAGAVARVYFSGAVLLFPCFVVVVLAVSFLATTFCVRWQSELYKIRPILKMFKSLEIPNSPIKGWSLLLN